MKSFKSKGLSPNALQPKKNNPKIKNKGKDNILYNLKNKMFHPAPHSLELLVQVQTEFHLQPVSPLSAS